MGQENEDLVGVGVNAQLLAIRAAAAREGLSVPAFLKKLDQAAASVAGASKAARGAAYFRSLPFVSTAFTGKEAYDLATDPNRISDFRTEHEELKKRGYRSVIPRSFSILANPLTTTKAAGEDIGEGLADVYLRNFRPELLPENYAKTNVPSSAARAARENALKEIYAKAEQEADQYPSLEDAYREVVSDEEKSPKFKKPKVTLRE